jgi:thiol:disulfide interchange protein DsbD
VVDDTDRIANALASRNLALIGALFFGLGILLTFTPCVLPMVPILSSIVVGEHVTRGRAFLVSLSYVLGMAVVYTTVGVAAGLAGEGLAAALQTPWVLGAFAALMVALAMSMFGMYELQMPQRWQARLTESSNRRQSGQFVGAALMGAISALIVGPCVTAPLAGALAYIAQTGDAITGGGGADGHGSRHGRAADAGWNGRRQSAATCGQVDGGYQALLRLPASGRGDLDGDARTAGLGRDAGMGGAAACGGRLSRRVRCPGPGPTGRGATGQGAWLLAALVGAIQIVGVASGGRNPLQPLSHLSLSAATLPPHAAEIRFERVRNIAELDARIAQASAAGRPVLLDFYADWCVSCKEMEKLTFPDAKVRAQLADVVLLQADVTANNADDRALLKRFGLFGPPGIILFGKDGQERPVRVIGYQSASRFLESLERALGPRSQT